MASAKRTGAMTLRSQYSGRVTSVLAARPSTQPTKAIAGSRKRMRRSRASYSASIGVISGEWNACETTSGRVLTPSASKRAATLATASASPEITICSGPLMAAIATRSSRPARAASTRASGAITDVIPPPAGSACISRPRAATIVTASSSVRPPATHMAPISPMLWPMTADGRTPQECHSSLSA
jgi:hypothetical protein